MICETHKTEMREGKYGPYCATPVRKSDDGTQVLEWCQFGQKPKSAKSNAQSEALVTIIKKLDTIQQMLASIGGTLPPPPANPEGKILPF